MYNFTSYASFNDNLSLLVFSTGSYTYIFRLLRGSYTNYVFIKYTDIHMRTTAYILHTRVYMYILIYNHITYQTRKVELYM